MFCETHTLFQIKLNAQARHDATGLWCRVCEGCFVKAKEEEDKLHAGGRVIVEMRMIAGTPHRTDSSLTLTCSILDRRDK